MSDATFTGLPVEIDVGRAGRSCKALACTVSFDVCDGMVESLGIESQVKGEADMQIDRHHWLYAHLLEAIHRTYQDRIDETLPWLSTGLTRRYRPVGSALAEHGTVRLHRGFPKGAQL